MASLTDRLVQISSAATKAADVYYHDAVGLKIRELHVLRLLHSMPGSPPTELLENLAPDKTLLSKNLAALTQCGLITCKVGERDHCRQCLYLNKRGAESVWWRKPLAVIWKKTCLPDYPMKSGYNCKT
ncbi:MarR family winged helix-turn-helix transcriptional regulator [Neisseria iguanae]|uniref:MarR family transcriptional regulator n=1 Tax=Neisseria iguanae TaxID=90242 RepID=A0A2P7TY29_9NEIS|nr:MarR family winged helix-turn-helix transcriptional regulator [Neisseria iguanae]PSJ79632.1 hypothetical protein C7N83_11035 [Neisseria iguanae]